MTTLSPAEADDPPTGKIVTGAEDGRKPWAGFPFLPQLLTPVVRGIHRHLLVALPGLVRLGKLLAGS
jgi:hypothetical protein